MKRSLRVISVLTLVMASSAFSVLKAAEAGDQKEEISGVSLWKCLPAQWPEGWKLQGHDVDHPESPGEGNSISWHLENDSEHIPGSPDYPMWFEMRLWDDGQSKIALEKTQENWANGMKDLWKEDVYDSREVAASDEFPERTAPLGLPGFRGYIIKVRDPGVGENQVSLDFELCHGQFVINGSGQYSNIATVRKLVSLINLPSPQRPMPPFMPIGAAFMALAALASLLKSLKRRDEASGVNTYLSGISWAITGAFFSAAEKLKDVTTFQQSVNPATGIPILGSHVATPLAGWGTVAGKAGVALTLGTQFLESKDIWQSNGSTLNRSFKEATSLGVNLLSAVGAGLLVGTLAETGPGLLAAFTGASAIGTAGEGAKILLYKLVDQYIP